MKIFTNYDLSCSPDQRYVIWWIRGIELNHPLWQCESDKIWKNTHEGIGRGKVHKSNIRIVQQTFYGGCIRTAHEKSRICRASFHCLNCSIPREWEQRSRLVVYVGPLENTFCIVSSAASLRSYSNALALELSEAIERLAG